MYSSIPAGSLLSCCELDQDDIRPNTPTSSVVDYIDWNDVSSLDEMMSQLDKHLSHLDCYVSRLVHDASCDSSSAVRLVINCCVAFIDVHSSFQLLFSG